MEVDWINENNYSDKTELRQQSSRQYHLCRRYFISYVLLCPGEGSTHLCMPIYENKRAVTIRVDDDVIGVAGFLLPGIGVDILNTVSYGKNSAATTQTVLKRH